MGDDFTIDCRSSYRLPVDGHQGFTGTQPRPLRHRPQETYRHVVGAHTDQKGPLDYIRTPEQAVPILGEADLVDNNQGKQHGQRNVLRHRAL